MKTETTVWNAILSLLYGVVFYTFYLKFVETLPILSIFLFIAFVISFVLNGYFCGNLLFSKKSK